MKFVPAKREKLLRSIARTGEILESLTSTGVHRSSYYNRRSRRPVFDHAVEIALCYHKTKKANEELSYLTAGAFPTSALSECLERLIEIDKKQ